MIPQRQRLQNRITAGRFTLPAVIVIAALLQTVAHLLYPSARLSSFLLSLLAITVSAYTLIVMNNSFALIRKRASVQTSNYILLISVCPLLLHHHYDNLAALSLLYALLFLFRSYQQKEGAGNLFHAFTFLGIGSLFLPPLIGFLPLFWLGSYQFLSLSPRSFFASLLGFALPFWFVLGHLIWHDQLPLLSGYVAQWIPFQSSLNILQSWQIATLCYLLLLFLVSAIHCLITGFDDKLRTRAFLQYLITLTLCLFLAVLLYPQEATGWMTLICIPVSILSGHLFVLTHSRSSNLFFIFSAILWLALYFYNILHQ